jgi:hypothetical protein
MKFPIFFVEITELGQGFPAALNLIKKEQGFTGNNGRVIMNLPAPRAGYLVSVASFTRFVLQGNYLTVESTTIFLLVLPIQTAAERRGIRPHCE